MIITHQIVECLSCVMKIEFFDDDLRRGDVSCPFCGYLIEFRDNRVITYTEDW